MTIRERISQLRKLMKEHKIDIYYVPNEDDHLSDEYTATYFQAKSFISGFTGDYGCVIVTRQFAGLWTDGRHFTQAEKELEGTGITLMRMRQEGVPTAVEYLISHTPKNGRLGFDGRVVSAALARTLAAALKQKNAGIIMSYDLVGEVWGDERPAMPKEKLFVLPKTYTGESAQERLDRVRAAMAARKANVLLLTELEDPCWLLNIRGRDLPCTPVPYAFAMITASKAVYYVDPDKMTDAVAKALQAAGVTVRPYEGFGEDLEALRNSIIWVSMNKLNAILYTLLDPSNTILNQPSPVLLFRARKNKKEIEALRNAHIRDGVAMVRFLCWLKDTVGKETLTEVDIQNKLYALRAEGKGYICPSFETICAYRGNAAMMHYTATEKTNAKVRAAGFLLVDSGGTYMDGTTDITRTISLGKLTADECRYYTLTLQGHLQLARARFLAGTTGQNLDILARGPVWNIDIDYQCGTGHGVGHVLSVHEGPQAVRWGVRDAVPLEEGMTVTDEPGVYIPDVLGVRIENELLCVKGAKNFYGQFLAFEPITYCPIDLDPIDVKLLNKADIDQLNEYHAMVYKTLSPLLDAREKAWLKQACRKLA